VSQSAFEGRNDVSEAEKVAKWVLDRQRKQKMSFANILNSSLDGVN